MIWLLGHGKKKRKKMNILHRFSALRKFITLLERLKRERNKQKNQNKCQRVQSQQFCESV